MMTMKVEEEGFEWQHGHLGAYLPSFIKPPSVLRNPSRAPPSSLDSIFRAFIDLYNGLNDGSLPVSSSIPKIIFFIAIIFLVIPVVLGAVMVLFDIGSNSSKKRKFKAVYNGPDGIIPTIKFYLNPNYYIWVYLYKKYAAKHQKTLESNKAKALKKGEVNVNTNEKMNLFESQNFGVRLSMWSETLSILFGSDIKRRVLESRDDQLSRELTIPSYFTMDTPNATAIYYKNHYKITGEKSAELGDTPFEIDHKFARIFHEAMRQLVIFSNVSSKCNDLLLQEVNHTVEYWKHAHHVHIEGNPDKLLVPLNLHSEMAMLISHSLLRVMFGSDFIDKPENRPLISEIDSLIEQSNFDLQSWILDILSVAPNLAPAHNRLISLSKIWEEFCNKEIEKRVAYPENYVINDASEANSWFDLLLFSIKMHPKALLYVPKALLRCFFEGCYNTSMILTFAVAQKLSKEFYDEINDNLVNKNSDFILVGETLRYYSPLFVKRQTAELFEIRYDEEKFEQERLEKVRLEKERLEKEKLEEENNENTEDELDSDEETEEKQKVVKEKPIDPSLSIWNKENIDEKLIILRIPDKRTISIPLINEEYFSNEFDIENNGFSKLVDKITHGKNNVIKDEENQYSILVDGKLKEGPQVKSKKSEANKDLVYIPFGHGRHKCPGAKLALTLISDLVLPILFSKDGIKDYKIKLIPPRPDLEIGSLDYNDEELKLQIDRMIKRAELNKRNYTAGNNNCPILNKPIYFCLDKK